MPQTQSQLLTIEAARSKLSIGRTTLYRLINAGEIETVGIGCAVRVPEDSVDRYIERQRSAARRYEANGRSSVTKLTDA